MSEKLVAQLVSLGLGIIILFRNKEFRAQIYRGFRGLASFKNLLSLYGFRGFLKSLYHESVKSWKMVSHYHNSWRPFALPILFFVYIIFLLIILLIISHFPSLWLIEYICVILFFVCGSTFYVTFMKYIPQAFWRFPAFSFILWLVLLNLNFIPLSEEYGGSVQGFLLMFFKNISGMFVYAVRGNYEYVLMGYIYSVCMGIVSVSMKYIFLVRLLDVFHIVLSVLSTEGEYRKTAEYREYIVGANHQYSTLDIIKDSTRKFFGGKGKIRREIEEHIHAIKNKKSR